MGEGDEKRFSKSNGVNEVYLTINKPKVPHKKELN